MSHLSAAGCIMLRGTARTVRYGMPNRYKPVSVCSLLRLLVLCPIHVSIGQFRDSTRTDSYQKGELLPDRGEPPNFSTWGFARREVSLLCELAVCLSNLSERHSSKGSFFCVPCRRPLTKEDAQIRQSTNQEAGISGG